MTQPTPNDPSVREHRGIAGSAQRITPNLDSRALMWSETVSFWLINSPWYHPLWNQYELIAIRLREVEGLPPPVRTLAGATHELVVITLDPGHRVDVDSFADPEFAPHYLTPENIFHQLIATDEEVEKLCSWSAWGVVAGHLNPETGDAPTRVRESWDVSLIKTLAHIRDEPHAP